jgi:hypothetical protein
VGTHVAAAVPRWSFASLPDHRLRVRVEGAPAGLHAVRIERARERSDVDPGEPATWDGRAWSVVLNASGIPDEDGLWIKGRTPDGRAWWSRGTYALWPAGTPMLIQAAQGMNTGLGATQVFEPSIVLTHVQPASGVPAGSTALTAVLQLLPADLPVQKPIPVVLELPASLGHDRVGMYHRADDSQDWDWVSARWDSTHHSFLAEVPRTGEFALLRDDTAPAVRVVPPPRRVASGPYSSWALRASVTEQGSGVDAAVSTFGVDGRRVPTEWDGVRNELRWRPRVAPSPGRHTWSLVVADHAGSRTVRRGAFVLDSTRR